jgi:hypothetical protein
MTKVNKKDRKIKVSYIATTNGNTIKKETSVNPKITLQGNWLERAGFAIGEITRVMVADGLIQIIKDASPKHCLIAKPQHTADDFKNFLDSLHFHGYSEQLQHTHPDQFNEMLTQYLHDYGND